MNKIRLLCFVFAVFAGMIHSAQAQRFIAITIDDIPNERLRKPEGPGVLLRRLDSLRIPITAFINEENHVKADDGRRISSLEQWASRPFVCLGNHSYSHPALSKGSVASFLDNVDRGAVFAKKLATKYGKSYNYFRFPYNDCGRDSAQQDSVRRGLQERGYTVAPFSLESADYAYNEVYLDLLSKHDSVAAARTGRDYIKMSLRLLNYLDSLIAASDAPALSHIYLCHDNEINRDYLPELIQQFRAQGYSCVSLDDAMRDARYHQPVYYRGRHGLSWIYRWIADSALRRQVQLKEPSDSVMLEAYQKLQAAKQHK